MGFGKPKPTAADWPPIEETESAVLENATTEHYQGFIPQRYIRPIAPHQETEHGQVPNNTLRGTEAHGLYIDSDVAPQNAPQLHYEETHDDERVVHPQYDHATDAYPPVPVRIVDQKPVEITRINVNQYPVVGTTPVRILGQDDKRVRALVGTSGTVTGTLYLLTDVNSSPVMTGFPLPAATAQPLEIRGDQELWASGGISTDAGSIAVYVERVVNGDAEHPSN